MNKHLICILDDNENDNEHEKEIINCEFFLCLIYDNIL